MQRVLQACIDRIAANPDVQARTGLTPAQMAVIALAGVTVFGMALLCYFVPAARNFVLNILGNGYLRVVQAMNRLDNMTGGRLSQAQSRLSAAWHGFAQFMSAAWDRLVCWANNGDAQNNAIHQDFVELNRRQNEASGEGRAQGQPARTASQENQQEVLRPAPPPPVDRRPGRHDLERGNLADDEASENLIPPALDNRTPLEPLCEEQCEGMDMLGRLADRLAAVGRCPATTGEDKSSPSASTPGAKEPPMKTNKKQVGIFWYKICVIFFFLLFFLSI